MRILSWLLPFAVASLSYAQTTGYRDDPRLKAPVSLDRNIVSTQEALSDLSQQTKVELLCAQGIADHKLTAFIKDKPAVEVMDRLAELTLGEWRSEAGRYRLFIPNKAQAEEKEAVDAERAATRANAEAQVRDWMRLAKVSLEEHKDRLGVVKDEVARFKGATDPASKKKYDALVREQALLDTIVREPFKYYAGQLFNQLSRGDWEQFWNGRPLLGATSGAKGFRQLPPQAIDPEYTVGDANGYLLASYDDQTGVVNLSHSSFRASKGQRGMFSNSRGSTQRSSDGYTGFDRTALSKSLEEWRTPFENPAAKDLLSKPVKPGAAPESPYFGKMFTTADHLEWLARQSGVQVLADAFRTRYPTAGFAKGDAVGAWLKSMLGEQAGFVRLEGDWVLYKPYRYWTLRTTEISERVLQTIERTAAQRPLEIQDFASFVAQLTPGQIESFDPAPKFAVRFVPHAISEAGSALSFWAQLPAASQQSLLRGKTLSVGEMSAQLRDAYWKSISSFILQGSAMDERIVLAFGGGLSPEQTADFAFGYMPPSAGASVVRQMYDGTQPVEEPGAVFNFKAYQGFVAMFITSFPKTKWPPPP